MKRSIFGVYQFDEVVGAVVLACIGVFVAVLINAGLMKDWFQPSFTLAHPAARRRRLGPGARRGGPGAGHARRRGAPHRHRSQPAHARRRPGRGPDAALHPPRFDGLDPPPVRRGGSGLHRHPRGIGPELDWSYAVIAATTDRAATDTLGQMIDEVRAKIAPVFDDVQKAVLAFTAVAQRAIDPAGPLEQTLSSAAGIARTRRERRGRRRPADRQRQAGGRPRGDVAQRARARRPARAHVEGSAHRPDPGQDRFGPDLAAGHDAQSRHHDAADHART